MTRVLVIADPFEGFSFKTDSSIALTEAAMTRGFSVWFCTQGDLLYRSGDVTVRAREVSRDGENWVIAPDYATDPLSAYDYALIRKDPPYDMTYVTMLHQLKSSTKTTRIVNDPIALLDFTEKVPTGDLFGYMPPFIITQRDADVRDFVAEFGKVVLKPLYNGGGVGVVLADPEDANFESLLELFVTGVRGPFLAQRYLPEVREGDRRVILMHGELVGAINRVPGTADFRSNLRVGGVAEAVTLDAHALEICDAVGAEMKRQNIVFAGLDLIGDYLTEVNITSPTGIRQLQTLGNLDAADAFWRGFEA